MIRLRGVTKTYRSGRVENRVLRGIDLDIADGDFVALMGRSGSGKTTLLNIIGGLDMDYEGVVESDGRDMRRMRDVELSSYRNQHVGFIFQSFHLLDHLSCRENVLLPARFARGGEEPTAAALRKRADEVLAQVDLSDKADDLPTTLSGGQKQRVAIARALLNRPSLMICDEPTGNLDRETAHAIIEIFRRINVDNRITMVLVTHDPEAASAARRLIEIVDGKASETPIPARTLVESTTTGVGGSVNLEPA